MGESAIRIHRDYLNRKRNFPGFDFRTRGYYVRTVGLDEGVMRNYIRTQDERERRKEQLALGLTP
jgi:putative transposase